MEDHSFYGGADPREMPLYAVSEAAHYIGLPPSTLRSWVLGRRYPVSDGWNASDAIVRLPDQDDGRLSFNNLIEAFVVKGLRKKHGASMMAIRKAAAYAEKELDVERLFLRDELCTNEGDLFWTQYSELINLSRGGMIAMKQIVEAHLKRVERDVRDLPLRLYPLIPSRPGARTIVIDPSVSFGRPIVGSSGVSTAVVVQRIDAGEEIEDLADDYGLSEDEIRDAVVYELAA
ncbi:MAG: DUF433 domain-containing protein [Rhodothermales bacterium]